MELIKGIESRIDGRGYLRKWAIFWCDYCKQEVEKSLNNGKICQSCGCVKGQLLSKANTGKKRTEEQNKRNSESSKKNRKYFTEFYYRIMSIYI